MRVYIYIYIQTYVSLSNIYIYIYIYIHTYMLWAGSFGPIRALARFDQGNV